MKRSIIVSILALSLGSTAFAKDIPVPDTKPELVVFAPDDFKLEGDKTMLSAENADDTCSFLWMPVDAANLEKAMAVLEGLLQKAVTGVKAEKAAAKTINGMKALMFAASGTRADTRKPVAILGMVVQTAPGKAMIVLGSVDDAVKAKYKATAEKVFGGVRTKK